MLQLKVGNIFTDIEGCLSPDQYRKLQRAMSFRPLGYEFSDMYNRWIFDSNGKKVRRMWDGWRRQIWKTRNGKKIYFPTGLFSIVKEFFNKNSIAYQSTNCRIKPEKTLNLTHNPELKIRDYQETVAKDSVTKTRGLIQIATGGGKTIIASAIIQRLGVKPFIFFVTSIDLLIQARKSFEETLQLDGKPLKVGQIGGGVVDIHDVNVMTVQTAVRVLGKKWDREHKFDSDDTDDNTSMTRRAEILKLLKTAKGVICDECVSGDAVVITKQGLVPMRELNKYIGKDILSFNDNSVVWKKITHFYSKGKKKTLKITLENGDSIKCTGNHPIMTKQGWQLAGKIHCEDQILCYANVVVDKKFASKEEAQANIPNTYSDTKLKGDQKKNDKRHLTKWQKQHRFANVDV